MPDIPIQRDVNRMRAEWGEVARAIREAGRLLNDYQERWQIKEPLNSLGTPKKYHVGWREANTPDQP